MLLVALFCFGLRGGMLCVCVCMMDCNYPNVLSYILLLSDAGGRREAEMKEHILDKHVLQSGQDHK